MDIGIGLPNPVPGTPGDVLVGWARSAESAGFSSLATIDRIAYPSYESLIALAAAGAATQRIGLMTNVLLGPTRNPVLLAKEAASVDQISGGRLTLGVGVGTRRDDFELAEQPFDGRGKRWDDALELLTKAWRGEPVAGSPVPITPTPVREGGIPLLIGGMSPQAIERTVRWGIGWTAGGSGPDRVGPFAEQVRTAWREAAKPGAPRIVALAYFGLGERAEERVGEYLTGYYGEWASQMIPAVPKDPDAVRETVKRFEDLGVDELILDPCIGEVEQVDLLAEAVL